MNGDKHPGGRRQGRHGQEAKLRRTVDDDDVIVCFNTIERITHTGKERAGAASLDGSRRLMFEFHEL